MLNVYILNYYGEEPVKYFKIGFKGLKGRAKRTHVIFMILDKGHD